MRLLQQEASSWQEKLPCNDNELQKMQQSGTLCHCLQRFPVHVVRQDDHPGEGDYLVGGVRDKPTLSTDPGWHVKLKLDLRN